MTNYPAGVSGKDFNSTDYIEGDVISQGLGTIEEVMTEIFKEDAITMSFPYPEHRKLISDLGDLWDALQKTKKSFRQAAGALEMYEMKMSGENPYDD
jgi:hypothetical protein